MEWWKADRARTSPSTSVAVRQTSTPPAIVRSSRLATEPCR